MDPARSSPLPVLLACGGSFLAFLDVTITNLAVPALTSAFGGVSVTALSWVITLYTVVFAALLAPTGRFADLLGRRGLFLLGLVAFTAASGVAAAAPTFAVLLTARFLQGAGAAAMLPASLAIVLADTPSARRGQAIGLWSAAASLAAVIGPALGGVLVDTFDWRALFLINLPLGLVLAVLARRLPTGRGPTRGVPDLLGTVLLAAGVAATVLAITEGQDWGWTDGRTLGALLGGLTAIAAALLRSRRHPRPAVQTALWHSHTYAAANAVSLLFGAVLFGWLLANVLFLVGVWHYSELRAGLAVTPGAVTSALVGIALSRVRRAPSPRRLVVAGTLLIGGTGLWTGLALPDQPRYLALVLPVGLICGAGIGAVSVGVSTAAAQSVAPQDFAGAVGLNVAARQVGGALGVAGLVALLHATSGGAGPFRTAYLAAAALCVVTALAAARLRTPPPPAPVATEEVLNPADVTRAATPADLSALPTAPEQPR